MTEHRITDLPALAADGPTRPSERLARNITEVRRIIAENGGKNPRIFGSVARGDDTDHSDLDILVDVDPADSWSFIDIAPSLSELLGTAVDVLSSGGLLPKHRRILAEAVPL